MSPCEELVSMAVDSSPFPSLFLSLSLYVHVPIVSVDSSIDITSMIRMSPSEGLVSMAVDSPSPSPSPSSELELSVELDCLACLFILCLARFDLEPTITLLLFLRFFGVRKRSTTLLLPPLASAPGGGLLFAG